MKSHYWYHNELFPHLYQLTPENLNEIEDILTFAIGGMCIISGLQILRNSPSPCHPKQPNIPLFFISHIPIHLSLFVVIRCAPHGNVPTRGWLTDWFACRRCHFWFELDDQL